MYPCSLMTRSMRCFRWENGTFTVRYWFELALRIRVRRSATGSVMLMGLPARFPHAGDLALQGQIPEANAADLELSVKGPAPAAELAPVVAAGRELGSPLLLHPPGSLGHGRYLLNGKPKSSRRGRDSSSLERSIVRLMLRPWTNSTSSTLTSGKTSCSDRPIE